MYAMPFVHTHEMWVAELVKGVPINLASYKLDTHIIDYYSKGCWCSLLSKI